MPKSEVGLRGYIGEAIVKQWLSIKYPECKIVSQIMPTEVDGKGGPYLDFGVVKDGVVMGVYEVKTQDYILGKNFHINKALTHIWDSDEKNISFKVQNSKEILKGADDINAYLILLVPPNDVGLSEIDNNIQYVKLFCEIFNESAFVVNKEMIYCETKKDIDGNLKILRNPKNGNTLRTHFFEEREKKHMGH